MAEILVKEIFTFLKRQGFPSGCRLGVALSGGADSVALLAAAHEVGCECVALHCNFHLRGDESDRDEAHCRRICEQLGCEIRVTHFNVPERVALTGESVEMACRELRYAWFREQYSHFEAIGAPLSAIAIAHNSNDNEETFFLNLVRGTGMRGLAGIPVSRDIYIRPLLNCSRQEIEQFLRARRLTYVVDSTNLQCDYNRNFLRNSILPQMRERFPHFDESLLSTISNLKADLELLDSFVADIEKKVCRADGSIDLVPIVSSAHPATTLFHILNRNGHNMAFSTVEKIIDNVDRSGLQYEGRNCRYLLDRQCLRPITDVEPSLAETAIDLSQLWVDGFMRYEGAITLNFSLLPPGEFNPTLDNGTIWLDADEVKENGLCLRAWRDGDRIAPFGMRGTKLVSDIFSDAGLSLIDKRRAVVMLSQGQILWVPRHRVSRHFKVTKNSRAVVRITVV